MITIKNKERLIKNGQTTLNQNARALILESLESALNAVHPTRLMRSKLSLKKSVLKANGHVFDLDKFNNVYVIGGGKASGSMAKLLEQILGRYITDGFVVVPQGGNQDTRIVEFCEASHPTPDRIAVEGARHILKIVERAKRDDLIICLISGGGSSLMTLPKDKITINDVREATNAFLKSGATIDEINTVRKHLSNFKGGWVAKKAYPATILNLILSDVVGDPLDVISSGPTVPDTTTFGDAIRIVKKYDLWEKIPRSIRTVLLEGNKGDIPETPKTSDKAFRKVYNVIIGNSRSVCHAICKPLKLAGLNTLLLTSTLEGEARHVGVMLASIAREVSTSGNPTSKPAGVVACGETTVSVTGKGLGGRNQEITLAAAAEIEGLDGVIVASLSTDGVDGPTDAAGAIADGRTRLRAAEIGLNPEDFLSDNDSYHFFSMVDDLIFTGSTGTNITDISIMVIL